MTEHRFLITDPDMDAVVNTLTSAFRDDPVLAWAFPHDVPRRDEWLDGFFRVTTEILLANGGLLAATPGYQAVLVFTPPGETLGEAENAKYLTELAAETGPCADRATTLMAALDEHYPADLPPHIHVMFAAAQRDALGNGVLLTRAMLQRRDPGVGLYAEASSPRNLALWQRLGMRRIGGEITLPGNGPTLFPIWQDAAPV